MDIRTLEEWREMADKGTSGDMVHDILASWAINKHNLEVEIERLRTVIREYEALEERVVSLEQFVERYKRDEQGDV